MPPPLHACKLSAVLFLCLLFLPSLFFSLILFSLFSFFLFLPIACILSSLYLLSSILIRVPNLPLGRILSPKNDHRGQDSVVGNEQDYVDLNSSEIPRLDDSSEEEEEEREEENREELERFQQQFIVESGGYKSFYEILSFWRSKERKDSDRTNC